MIRLIAAMDSRRGIADEQGIPWQGRLPTDAKYFRHQTAEGTIMMGFRTYEEFAAPLHDRPNFVLSRAGSSLRPGFEAAHDLDEFFAEHAGEDVWVIGGAGVFARSIGRAHQLYTTELGGDFQCTKLFPQFEDDFLLASESAPQTENDISFRFRVWHRRGGRDTNS